MKQQEQRQFIEKKKNKIIIRDAKHSTYSFFGILAKLVVYFLKFLLILFAIPCIICFVVITFLAICSIWYLKDGLIFLGILLAILGAILINYIVLKVIYYFIFEIKHSFKKLFMFIISGLILISMGGSIAFCNYISFKKITISDKDYIITNHELSYKDGLVLEFLKYNNVTIVEDNTQTRIKIEVKHDPNSKETLFSNQHISSIRDEEGNYLGTNSYDVFDIGIDYTYDGIDGINYLLKMLKNKERFDLKQDIGAHQITITASKDILDKLDENYSQLFYQ